LEQLEEIDASCPRPHKHGAAMMKRIVVLIIAIWTCGCMTWRPQLDPVSSVLQSRPTQLRISSSPAARVVLEDLTLTGDTLFGVDRSIPLSPSHHAFAVDQITSVETLHFSPVRTGLLLLGIPVAAAVGIGAYFLYVCRNGCS
jgi:hypothetical protein